MRTDTVFKLAFNTLLDRLDDDPGLPLTENALANRLGISRTTSRKVQQALLDRGLILFHAVDGWRLLRPPVGVDRFPVAETTSRLVQVEHQFMDWMLHTDARPGTLISELDLSRQFNVATGAIREFLIRFSRFGLVEKKPNSGWLFLGFTHEFALDLFEVRVLMEMRSIRLFTELPEASPLWGALRAQKAEHERLAREIETRFHDFSDLDDRFHRLIASARPNRFITDFHGIIALIFHYHYQWNKVSERVRNEAAIAEHLDLIDALQSRSAKRSEKFGLRHLNSARTTLLQSLSSAR